MPADPPDLDAPPAPRTGVARYRDRLRSETLRRSRPYPLIHRWSWLLPRILTLLLVGPVVRVVGLMDAPLTASAAAPARAPSPAPTVTVLSPNQGGLVIVISKTMILVGDDPTPVVLLAAHDELVRAGIDARYKHGDLLVVPLASAVARARIEQARTGDDRPLEAIIVADQTTPYRVLSEVLFTLGQSEIGAYHFMVRSGKKK